MPVRHRNGRTYFYRNERVGGRHVTRYLGSGYLGEQWAEMLAVKAEQRRREVEEWRATRRRAREADRVAREFFQEGRELMRAALEAAGCRQHQRGAWRMRRDVEKIEIREYRDDIVAGVAWPDELAGRLLEPFDEAGVKEVLALANDGDAGALATLKALYRRQPGCLAVHTHGHALGTLARVQGGDKPGNVELFKLKVAREAELLAGPDPSPLASLLAERTAYCRAYLDRLELEMHVAHQTSATDRVCELYRRRVDSAHRRFLSSARALVVAKRLEIPATVGPFFVAMQQNNGGMGPAPGGQNPPGLCPTR